MTSIYLKLFVDCLEKYQKLNDTEFGRLVRAALRYKATGAEPDDLGREALLWDGMRLDIDRDNEAYRNILEQRSEAGKKGANARWQNHSKNGNCHLPYGKKGQDKEEDKEEDKEYIPPLPPKANKGSRFAPPSVEEVAAYCKERGNSVDPNRFVDFYASKGWLVGKAQMKDWRAAVRNWEREERPAVGSNRPAAKPGPVTYHTESSIDMDKVREFELSDVPVYGEGPR